MEVENTNYTRNEQKHAALRLFLNHFEMYGLHEDFFQRVKEREGLIAEMELREMYNTFVCPLKKRM